MKKTMTPKEVRWDVTPADQALIKLIVKRAKRANLLADVPDAEENVTMDLEATHANGCPLDLVKLLRAPASDFGHDLLGISKYLDRTTGTLRDFFLPRCAR